MNLNYLKTISLFFKQYNVTDLKSDIIAGLVFALVVIPLALANGELAGVGAITGLKASIFPLLIYALFSSSKIVVIGAVTSASILTGAAVEALNTGGADEKAFIFAALLSLLVGIFLIIGGISRIGYIADFVPKPILSGFLSGLGIIVITGQIGKTFGINIPASDNFLKTILSISSDLSIHIPTLLVGIASLAILNFFSYFLKWIPGQLVVMIAAIISVKWFHIDSLGVKIIGEQKNALPYLAIPHVTLMEFLTLAYSALSIALLIFTNSLLISRAFASKQKTELDINKEVIALGLANLTGGFSQAMPVGLSASRTGVLLGLGARTRLANMITPIAIILFLLMGGIYYIQYLPKAVLGAILIMAGLQIIEFKEIKNFYRIRKQAFIVSFVTLIGVLCLGILEGVFVAVVMSFALVIHYLMTVPCKVLKEELIYPYVEREELLLLHVGPGIFFANANKIRSNIKMILLKESPKVKYVILDALTFINIDYTGLEMLEQLDGELRLEGKTLGLMGPKPEIIDTIERYGITKNLLIFSSLEEFDRLTESEKGKSIPI